MSTDKIQYADDLQKIDVFPMGKIFRLTYDVGVDSLRIIAKSKDDLDDLRDAFSITNPGAFFSKQYGYKADAKIYNINKFGFFYSGLVYDILNWVKTNYGTLQPVAISANCKKYISDILTPLKGKILEKFSIYNISDDSGRNSEIAHQINDQIEEGVSRDKISLHEFTYRDYQHDAVKALITKGYGRGLIQVPTAGGKSFILANFIWNIWKNIDRTYKALILVPNVQLVKQFYNDLLDYGYEKRDLAMFCGALKKKERLENDITKAKIIIANRQYVFTNSKLIPEHQILICDEVHTTLAQASQEFVTGDKSLIKVGCTGTLPDSKYDLNNLIGMFGRIVYKQDITTLQSAGFISKLNITTLKILDTNVLNNRNLLFHPNSLVKFKSDGTSDIRFNDAVIAEHEYFAKYYMDLYKPVLEYVNSLNGNTLVLFDKIDIGTNIYEYYKELFPNALAFYNDGQTDVDIRESTRASFEKSDGNVLFANVQIMSTGVNIKRLHNVVFCFAGKSTVRVIQSIGRILRLYKDKDYANLIDVVFSTKYSQRHYGERLQLYKEFYNKSKPDYMHEFTI